MIIWSLLVVDFLCMKSNLRLHDHVPLKPIKMVKFWSGVITSRTFFVQYILFYLIFLPCIHDPGSGPEHIIKRRCSLTNLELFCTNED